MSCSKLHLAILFNYFSCICIKSFHFSIPSEFFFSYSNAYLRHSSFSLFSSRLIFSIWYRLFSSQLMSKNYDAYLVALTFCVSFSRISSTALLTIALFSRFFFLSMGLFPWSLLGLILAYLAPKSPRTLHSSEECPWTLMKQVFDSIFEQSTNRFWSLPALPPIMGWVLDKAACIILFLMWPEHLAYSQVGFNKRVILHLFK